MLRIVADNCSNCGDTRKVWNQELGLEIRCVECTRPAADPMPALDHAPKPAKERTKPMTGLVCTIGLLRQWGKMVRERGIGYPSMSSTENARIGRGHAEPTECFPPDIQAVNDAVFAAPIDYKAVLVQHYTKDGSPPEKAARLGVSKPTYYARKDKAERHIAMQLGV